VNKVIVVYGGKFCYVNADEPLRKMQIIIEEEGPHVARIDFGKPVLGQRRFFHGLRSASARQAAGAGWTVPGRGSGPK
jgi:hypothetical protein